MKNRTRLVVYGLISSVLFIAFISNVDVFGRYLDQMAGTSLEKVIVGLDPVYRYSAMILFYFFSFLVAIRKFDQTTRLTFICLFLPVILIDSTVFIDGMGSIPLRFPFQTLFPVIGLGCAAAWLSKNRWGFTSAAIFAIVFTVCSKLYFIPGITAYMENRQEKVVE